MMRRFAVDLNYRHFLQQRPKATGCMAVFPEDRLSQIVAKFVWRTPYVLFQTA